MKKFVLGFIMVTILVFCQTAFASFSEKTLLDDKGKSYVTIDSDLYTIDYVEYDTIEVTCNKTSKKHTFILSKDAYQLKHEYYYRTDIIKNLKKTFLIDIINYLKSVFA